MWLTFCKTILGWATEREGLSKYWRFSASSSFHSTWHAEISRGSMVKLQTIFAFWRINFEAWNRNGMNLVFDISVDFESCTLNLFSMGIELCFSLDRPRVGIVTLPHSQSYSLVFSLAKNIFTVRRWTKCDLSTSTNCWIERILADARAFSLKQRTLFDTANLSFRRHVPIDAKACIFTHVEVFNLTHWVATVTHCFATIEMSHTECSTYNERIFFDSQFLDALIYG